MACRPSSSSSSRSTSSLNRFHVLVLLCWQFTIFFATQMLFGIFTTYTPRWRCNPFAAHGGPNGSSQGSPSSASSSSTPTFGRDCSVYEQCRLSLEFEPSPFASAAVEFDWVCGAGAYKKALYSQVQFIGVLVGTLLLAPLSDRLGRKPVGLATFCLGLLALALSSLAATWQMLLFARFVVSLLMGGTLVVVATFTMEIMPAEHRMTLRTFCNWGTSRLLLTLLCFLFPDWRSASVVCALVSVPALLLLAFGLPESPTWLHSQNKLERMRRSEKWMAQFAGLPYVPVEHSALPAKRPHLWALFRDRTLLCRLLVLWSMWFTSSFSSYSIDLNSSNISGDLFLNQALLSCPVIVSKMLLFLLDSNWPSFSRRRLHQWAQSVVCLCFLLLTGLILLDYDGVWILVVNLFGVIFLEFTWDANVLSAVESMPTDMRASALGLCSVLARIGGSIAPLLVFMNDLWPASAYSAVATLGALNLAVSYLWLIDTKGVDLDAVQLSAEAEESEEEGGLSGGGREKEMENFLPIHRAAVVDILAGTEKIRSSQMFVVK